MDRYVTTDLSLLDIARDSSSKHPLVNALLLIQESLQGKRLARDAIAAARDVQIKGSDPELMILMLSSWAELSNNLGRPSETEALIHRAKAMISDSTHPLVRAYALFAEAALSDTSGNKAAGEKVLREILTTVPEHSPRHKLYVWELALFLSRQGRGTECRNEIRSLTWQCNERFDLSRILMVHFVDAVETGNIREASELMPRIATSARMHRQLTRIPYRGYQLLLYMMHGVDDRGTMTEKPGLDRRGASVPLAAGMQAGRMHHGKRHERPARSLIDSPAAPDWINVVQELLNGDPAQALKVARRQANRMLGSIMGSGFDSFSLVRAELAAGNAEAARHVLNLRQSRGNIHYLDDFFFARADILDQNPKSAASRFAEVLKAIDFYNAGGRLDFEMKLACELSHGDIVQLTQAAGRIAERQKKHARKTSRERVEQASPPAPNQPGRPMYLRADERTAEDEQPASSDRAVNTIIGRSAHTRQIRETILRFADLDAPVLITGETGTGKELIARSLHGASRKRDLPFTPVNCSSITETLLESELFGYERGAFTGAEKTTKGLFEATGKGVIFLDEIGDISPGLQLALLRVLETGEIRAVGSTGTRNISCRIMAATNARLDDLADAGRFRRDLLYRLQRLMVHIPPLRERPNDILPLVRHFLDKGRRVGSHASLSPRLVEAVKAYDWPGNVRELKNVVERMRLMHSDKLSYDIDDLDLKFQSIPVPVPAAGSSAGPSSESVSHGEPALPSTRQPVPGRGVPPAGIDAFLKSGRSQLRRLDRLRDLFREHGKMTRNEIVHIMAVSPNTATKDLKALCNEKFITRVEPSASTRSHYFVISPDTFTASP